MSRRYLQMMSMIAFVAVLVAIQGAGCGDGGSSGGGGGDGDSSSGVSCADACSNASSVCQGDAVTIDYQGCMEGCQDGTAQRDRDGRNCLSEAAACAEVGQCIADYWSEEPEDDGELTSRELGRHTAALKNAYCERKHEECCTDEESAAIWDGGVTDDPMRGCTGEIADSPKNDALLDSIENGRVELDLSSKADCVSRLEQLSCDEFGFEHANMLVFNHCQDMFVPKVDIGGDCLTQADCISGVCAGSEIGEKTLGTCVAIAQQDEECDTSAPSPCAEGLYCDRQGFGEPGICTPHHQTGEECMFDEDCASHQCVDDGEGGKSCAAPMCNEQ